MAISATEQKIYEDLLVEIEKTGLKDLIDTCKLREEYYHAHHNAKSTFVFIILKDIEKTMYKEQIERLHLKKSNILLPFIKSYLKKYIDRCSYDEYLREPLDKVALKAFSHVDISKINDIETYISKAPEIAKSLAAKKFINEGILIDDSTYDLRNIDLNNYIHLYHNTIRRENINPYLISLGAFKTKDRLKILNKEILECYITRTYPELSENKIEQLVGTVLLEKANIAQITDEDKVLNQKILL